MCPDKLFKKPQMDQADPKTAAYKRKFNTPEKNKVEIQ